MSYALTGLEGKVAVVTGGGRLRSIGRPIAIALARAGCDIVLTGTGRDPADAGAARMGSGSTPSALHHRRRHRARSITSKE